MTAPSVGVATPLSGMRSGAVRQATFVEAHRAQSEVIAAVMAAREMPRVSSVSVAAMRDGCTRRAMAGRAFYRYNRGGGEKPITGGTIQLARFLALCWGNLQYGITELSRDATDSQMQAWAWDLQSNTRPTTTFIVPHGRVVGSGADKTYRELDDPRDIYENNANMGARRVREMIFAVMPPWFVDMATDLCRNTLANGEEGEELPPMPVRIAGVIDAFAKMGVSRRQLEVKQGRDADDWTPEDLASLHIVYVSMRRGESTRADEFEPDRVPVPSVGDTPAADADAARTDAPTDAPAAEAGPEADAAAEAKTPAAAPAAPSGPARPATAPRSGRGGPSGAPQHRKLLSLMRAAGFPGDLAALYVMHHLADGTTHSARGDLSAYTVAEMSAVINQLTAWQDEGDQGDNSSLARHIDEILPDEGAPEWGPVEAARDAYAAEQAAAAADAPGTADTTDPQ